MHIIYDTFKATDGKNIFYYKAIPKDPKAIKGIVQIAHGLGEHAGRYETFTDYLLKNGYIVYANDHRGHGKTAESEIEKGYTEKGSFWEKAIQDMDQLNSIISKNHPSKPIFLFGHSMGSLFSREYVTRYGAKLKGVLFSGTASYHQILGGIGFILTSILLLFKGRMKRSKLLRSIMFNDFNRKFKPNRTDFDWLSRDKEKVDVFINDPLRIRDFSIGLFWDLLKGTRRVNQNNFFNKTPKNLPIFLFSGSRDPVGEMGKGVNKIYKAYKKMGIEKLNFKLYSEGRHEMLNEVNYRQVFTDVVDWLNMVTSK